MSKPRVLLIWNDTIHHKGSTKSEFWAKKLIEDGFEVERVNSTYPLCDPDQLRSYSLIILSWSEEHIIREQALNLIDAVGYGGVGLAGYHEMSTAFRQYDWHFLLGSFMATHPGLAANKQKERHIVNICKPDDPIMQGISSFEHVSEQFYLLHDGDNLNEVLADTVIANSDYPWIKGLRSPLAYKRKFGAGRIFYSALGHFPEEFEMENVFTIMHRGMLWAAKTRPDGVSADAIV